MADSNYDRRADILAVLTHPTRRNIRDLLRKHGELTLTEIAHRLGLSEQNVYHHLTKLVEAGVVDKRKDKIDGRLVTFYRLSRTYNELIKEDDVKVDLLPIYALFVVYGLLLLLSLLIPHPLVSIFEFLGINNAGEVVGIFLSGFVTTTVILIYYMIRYYKHDRIS